MTRPSSDLHYRMVAEVYEEAFADPYLATPVEAVMATWDVNRATADSWVHRARKRGLLPPSRRIRLRQTGAPA